ncbi:hypothetical protein [Rhodopirellula bahusiensis]|uniref:Uncharacterized protein n=1 Tax=Rhodopirellula bahusiensis TaxID=2014065 RepID=A0A2G1W7J4_9BACT|nr:hypothetical protein [Rhodopirellula bahusiensis]PHQ35003.1 hypothetical protein CEE69_11245 [Rhodopirellula bahusiensis]
MTHPCRSVWGGIISSLNYLDRATRDSQDKNCDANYTRIEETATPSTRESRDSVRRKLHAPF